MSKWIAPSRRLYVKVDCRNRARLAVPKRCKDVFQNHRSYGANHEERTQLAERSGKFATIAESLANVEALFLSRSLL
jgi:hypothetical protein